MTDEKLIAMARLAQRDDRMATGALYGDLADRIEALIQAVQHANDHADAAIADMAALVKSRDEYRMVARVLDDRMVAAEDRAERFEAALQEIAAEAYVPVETKKHGGIKYKWMYFGWREIAIQRIDIARAALEPAAPDRKTALDELARLGQDFDAAPAAIGEQQ